MMRFTTISSMFLLGTTFGFLMKGWLQPEQLTIDIPEDDIHLYL